MAGVPAPPLVNLLLTCLAGVRAGPVERIALAPDWLFGRGCLTHVRKPLAVLRVAAPGAARATTCELPPAEAVCARACFDPDDSASG
eukprot:580902-Prymnesium_polylepis.1